MINNTRTRPTICGLISTILVLSPQIAMPEVCIGFNTKPLEGVVLGITESSEVILEPDDLREGGAPILIKLVEYKEISPEMLRLAIGGRKISCTKLRNQTDSESESNIASEEYKSTIRAHCCVAFVGTLHEGASRVESVDRVIEALVRN